PGAIPPARAGGGDDALLALACETTEDALVGAKDVFRAPGLHVVGLRSHGVPSLAARRGEQATCQVGKGWLSRRETLSRRSLRGRKAWKELPEAGKFGHHAPGPR